MVLMELNPRVTTTKCEMNLQDIEICNQQLSFNFAKKLTLYSFHFMNYLMCKKRWCQSSLKKIKLKKPCLALCALWRVQGLGFSVLKFGISTFLVLKISTLFSSHFMNHFMCKKVVSIIPPKKSMPYPLCIVESCAKSLVWFYKK